MVNYDLRCLAFVEKQFLTVTNSTSKNTAL